MLQLILLGFFAVSLAHGYTGERTLFTPDAKMTEDIRQAIVKCYGNPDIKDLIKLYKAGKYRDDPDFQELVSCIFDTTGFSKKDGSVIREKVLELFRGKENLILDVFDKCSKLGGSTPEETTFAFYKCFQDESPCLLDLEVAEN